MPLRCLQAAVQPAAAAAAAAPAAPSAGGAWSRGGSFKDKLLVKPEEAKKKVRMGRTLGTLCWWCTALAC